MYVETGAKKTGLGSIWLQKSVFIQFFDQVGYNFMFFYATDIIFNQSL